MIPLRREGQSFEDHQAEIAMWLGTDVDAMNADHDRLHTSFCKWLSVPSNALRQAAGERLNVREAYLADIEEQAVCHVQRFLIHAGVGVPE